MVHFVRSFLSAIPVVIYLLGQPGQAENPCCPKAEEKPKPEVRTLAQILEAYQKRTNVPVEYLPDGARLASSHKVTADKNAPKGSLDKLNLEQIKQHLIAARLTLITQKNIVDAAEVTRLTAVKKFLTEASRSSETLYIGSLAGELAVLRHPCGKAEDALILLAAAQKFSEEVANKSRLEPHFSAGFRKLMEKEKIPQTGNILAPANVVELVSRKLIAPSPPAPEVPGNLLERFNSAIDKLRVQPFQSEHLTALYSRLELVLPDVNALPKMKTFHGKRSGLTLSSGPAASVIFLKLLLGSSDLSDSSLPRHGGWDIGLAPTDQEGRFVASFALEHAWANNFEYQRAFVPIAAQPTLKISGIRSIVESTLKDYIAAKGLKEEASAQPPETEKIEVPSALIITPPPVPLVAAPAGAPMAAPVAAAHGVVDTVRALPQPEPLKWEAKLASHLLADASGYQKDISDDQIRAACIVLLNLILSEPAPLLLDGDDLSQSATGVWKLDWVSVAQKNGFNSSPDFLLNAYTVLSFATPALQIEAFSPPDREGAELEKPKPLGGDDKEATISRPALLAASSDDGDPTARAISDGFRKLAAIPPDQAVPPTAAAPADGKAATEKEGATEATPEPPPPPAIASKRESPLLRGVAVHADVANNSLLVVVPRFRAADAVEFMRFLEQLIEDYDQGRKMVEISVAIIDMDTTVAEEWGTRFAVASNGNLEDYPAFGVAGFRVPVPAPGKKGSFSEILNPSSGVPQIPTSTVESVALSEGLNIGALLVGSSTQFLATLHALERDGKGQVLSRPSVLTLDNSEAVLAEETKLYLPATGLNTGTLAEVPTGLKIAVTPQIVCLGEDSEKRPAVRMRIIVKEGTGSNTKKLPSGITVVDNSQFKTVAVIEQGQSLMVAGRLRHEETSGDDRVPILGRIPIVSRAFKNANSSKSRQQRVVLITPSIVDQDTYHSEAAAEAGNLFREPELPHAKPPRFRTK